MRRRAPYRPRIGAGRTPHSTRVRRHRWRARKAPPDGRSSDIGDRGQPTAASIASAMIATGSAKRVVQSAERVGASRQADAQPVGRIVERTRQDAPARQPLEQAPSRPGYGRGERADISPPAPGHAASAPDRAPAPPAPAGRAYRLAMRCRGTRPCRSRLLRPTPASYPIGAEAAPDRSPARSRNPAERPRARRICRRTAARPRRDAASRRIPAARRRRPRRSRDGPCPSAEHSWCPEDWTAARAAACRRPASWRRRATRPRQPRTPRHASGNPAPRSDVGAADRARSAGAKRSRFPASRRPCPPVRRMQPPRPPRAQRAPRHRADGANRSAPRARPASYAD